MSFSEASLGAQLWMFGLRRTFATKWMRIVSSALGLAVAVSALMGVGLAGTAAVRSFEDSIDVGASGSDSYRVTKLRTDDPEFSSSDFELIQRYGTVTPLVEFPVVASSPVIRQEILELPLTVTDTAAFKPNRPTELFAPSAVIASLPSGFANSPSLFVDGKLVEFSSLVTIPVEFNASFSLVADFAHPALNWISYRSVLITPFVNEVKLKDRLASAGFAVQRTSLERSSATESGSMLAAFSLNIAVMAILTAVVAFALLLISSIRMSEERRHDALVLRAFGANPVLISSLLLMEALFCGVLGALLALTLGQFVVASAAESILDTASGLFLGGRRGVIPDFHSPLVIASTIGVAIGLSVLGAIVPVYNLVTNLVGETKSRKVSAGVDTLSLVLIVSVIVVTGVLWILADTYNAKSLALSCAVASIFTVAAFAYRCIGLAVSFGHRISALRFYPALIVGAGLFSAIKGTLSRAAAVGAVSITLIVSLSCMVDSFRASLASWALQSVSADVAVRALMRGSGVGIPSLNDSLIQELLRVPNMDCLELKSHGVTLGELLVVGISKRCAEQQLISGRLFHAANEVTVNEAAARQRGVGIGDFVAGRDGQQLLIVGIIKDFSTQGPQVIVDLDSFEKIVGESAQIAAAALYGDRSGARVQISDVNKVLKGRALALSGEELRSVMLSTFDETFLITRFMRWCVMVLAVITIVVLYGQGLAETASQRGVFELLGASRFEQIIAVSYGSLIFAAVVCTIGLLGGYVSAIVLIDLVNPISFGWSFPLIFSFWKFFALAASVVVIGIVFGALGRRAEVPIQRVEESLR